MKITSISYLKGKFLEQVSKEIKNQDWQIDDTPNFINFQKEQLNSKIVREQRYNKYEHFTRFVASMYPNAQNILDVGSGYSESSLLLHQLGYKVTALDNFNAAQLMVLRNSPINYKFGYFDLNTNLQEYDLITGLHCCEGIEMIIRNCLQHNKEFAVTICETNKVKFETRKHYIDYLKNISSKLKITILPIYDSFEKECWGETIYYKKALK